MNELPTAKPLESSSATDRPAPSLRLESGDWKTAQHDTTSPPQVTIEAGDRSVTTLWTAALGLCLRRYGAPQTATLTILTQDHDTAGSLSPHIDLAFADAMRAAEWLAATGRLLRMNDAQDAGRDPARQQPPIDGWRVALLLHSDLPLGDHTVFSAYEQVFAIRSQTETVRLSISRKQTRHTGECPVDQILAHWEQLAIGLAQTPDAPVGLLPALTPTETEVLIQAYEKPRAPIKNPRFGFELFDDQVALTPDALAVTEGDTTINYRELWERSNRLAHYLQQRGVGPETIVGVFLERSVDLVVAVIALQKAGGAYLPIDPAYPRGRLEYLVSDSRVSLIITRAHLAPTVPPGDHRIVQVDREAAAIAAMDARVPVHGLKPGNMSFVFYTSGSTGQPKGVVMQHVVRGPFDRSRIEPDNLAVGEKALLKSAVGFTLILREIFWPLQWGGHLVVVPQGMDSDSAYLVRVLRDHNVVGANFVPSMLSLLVDEPAFEQCTSLRLIYTVGESLAVEVQRRLFARLPKVRLFVFYGCTEAPAATFRECRPDEPYGNRIVIGKPMANKKVYLLDRNLMPVPPGVAGEINTGGSISRGYLHRPGLTADRFIPNPFSEQRGERMYRTGDLARRLPDGNLEFLGRADFQVQVRGVRVELGEIEAAIGAHPAIKESLVIADPRHPDQTRLLAYYTARDGRPPPVAELRSGLRRHLPEYMIPSSFTRLETFPLNANGKIDRRRLPAPDTAAEIDQKIILPRTAEEVRLTGVWSRMLRVNSLGMLDNFFDRGGDSMLAAKTVMQINREFGTALSLPDFYREPTIAAVARLLVGKNAGSGLRIFLPISTSGNRRPVFMANAYPSLAQHFGPDQPFYGMKGHWLDARFDFRQDVSAIVRDYLYEMRKIQTTGPYVVFGFSMGGLFALELARQLEEAGQALDCLLLLDPTLPDDCDDEDSDTEPAAAPARPGPIAPTGWLQRHRTGLRGLSTAQKFAYVGARCGVIGHVFQKYWARLKLLLGQGLNAIGWDVPFALRQRVATAYYRQIRNAYRPTPLRSRAIVYLIGRHAQTRQAVLQRLFPSGLEVRVLDTQHHLEVMNEPYLSRWMDELKSNLADTPVPASDNAPTGAIADAIPAADPVESDSSRHFRVTRNDEGQYSVWPADWSLPAGWIDAGFRGNRETCLAHVHQIWIDPRPASLR